MTSYQDVLAANGTIASWALTETSGLVFAPWRGGSNLAGTGAFSYQQAGPFPTAFGLQLHVAARLQLAFVAQVFPPFTAEVWLKLTNTPPATLVIPMYVGNSSANGSGLYIATNGHLHFLRGGIGDIDTGYVWPDTNWHLVDYVSELGNIQHEIYVDGLGVYSAAPAAPTSPVPNVIGFGSDGSTSGAPQALSVSYPSLFASALSATRVYANILAATDPDQALLYVQSAAGQAPTDILTQILQSVRKTY